MSLDGMEAVCVKLECDSDGCGDNEAALAALYEDHVVKQELVLGPELLHKPSVVYTPPAAVMTPQEAACVKPEQGRDSDGHSETQDHELNEELVDEDLELGLMVLKEELELGPVVLKEELELGPVVLQPPDALYSLREQDQTKKEQQTKKANKRQVEAIKNKGKPSKHNNCSNNVITKFQEPSTPTQEVLPSKAQIQKISSEGLVVNSSSSSSKRNSAAMIQKPSDIQEATPEQPAASSSSSEVNTLTAETNFKCDMCGKDFSVKSDIEKHMRTHMLSIYSVAHKTYGGKFDTKLLLLQHAKSRHGEKYFNCGESLQKTEVKNSHARTLLNGRCSVVLERVLVDLEARICTIGPQTHSFRLCEQKQDIPASTEVNSRNNKIRQIRLPAAKKTKSAKTRKPKALVEEKKAKPSEKIAKTNSADSSSEVNTLTADTNFKCDKCGKGFNSKSDLEKHLNTHMLMEASTSRKVSKFTCKSCNCTFDTKLRLQEHEKSRHDVKYFACKECEYVTKRASSLQAHLWTHTDEKPFKCSQCSFAFTRSGTLQRHIRTHTGEKPFKCIQCSSAFTQSNDLKRHIRSHTGEKPFKCTQCSSAYPTSSKLRVHLRTHSGEKPFECNICDYKATRAGTLKDHLMSLHSGQKPFGCDACSYRGATKALLRSHIKWFHKSA